MICFLEKKMQKQLTKIIIVVMVSHQKLSLPVQNTINRKTLPVDVNDVLIREIFIQTDLVDCPFLLIF